jgi:hypothetical protein
MSSDDFFSTLTIKDIAKIDLTDPTCLDNLEIEQLPSLTDSTQVK